MQQHGTFLGRFAWKFFSLKLDSPFHKIVNEANEQGDDWLPLQAGLFGGSYQTFNEVATRLKENLEQLHWK
jgi:hypothetical protein